MTQTQDERAVSERAVSEQAVSEQAVSQQTVSQPTRPGPDGADPAVRTRTYSWTDPAATFESLAGRSGYDLLAAIAAGELPPPPIMRTLGIEPVEFGEGRAQFALDPQELHYNPLGTVHGGVLATLLDSATGCAVHSLLPAGTGYTTLDLNSRYLRPVTAATGRIIATGVVLSKGARTALAQARLTDERDRLLAHATSTCLILDLAGSAPLS
jgi:uncharacterized protein (TIGR00369 family)